MNDFARKVTEDSLNDHAEQDEAVAKLAHHILMDIRNGLIKCEPIVNIIYVDGIAQVVRQDLISIYSAEVFENFIEIYVLGYKICPECEAEMEQYITHEDPRVGIIWNWICPKCKYMDPKGWVDKEPK